MKIKVVIKIHELMNKTGLSLREIGRRTDISHAILSKMGQQKREYVFIDHIIRIAETFNITDIREIIDFEITED